ncbi:phage portal protein [Bacillota bacterium Lsc_1132]
MAVVVNKVPQLLETLTTDQAKAAAATWVQENGAFLKDVVDKHKAWIAKAGVEKYQQAYDGTLESVDTRDKSRDDEVNHKLQVNYAQLIIDTVVDYMLGKAPIWTVEAEQDNKPPDLKLLDEYRKDIIKLLRTEDAQRVLAEQLRQGSIAGYSPTLAWVDENGNIDYDEFPVQEVAPVFDNRGRLRLVVRYYLLAPENGETAKTKLEIYDNRYVIYAISDETGASFLLDPDEVVTGNPIEHKAARIPGGLFINGTPARHEKRRQKAGASDLSNGVFSLLEEYASALSDKANTVDRLLDQYLLLTNVDTDKDEVKKMRKSRAIALKSKDSNAQFLAPNQDDKAVENYLDRLKEAIHEMTQVPKLSDLSGSTATEIKMKYAGLDIKAGKKEIYFMAAVKQLVAVLTDMLNWKRLVEAGTPDPYQVLTGQATSSVPLYNADWLQTTLTRNLPQNYLEIAQIVAQLTGIVPDSYLYELLWFIEDPAAALEEMKKQKETAAKNQAAAGLVAMGFGGEFGSTGSQGGNNGGTGTGSGAGTGTGGGN